MGKSTPLPQPQPFPLGPGLRPLPLVPRSMDEALTLAKAVVASRMAPRGLETPEACLIAIMHGLEVGLTPLMALQRIAVIDGRPTIWGDGAMALVRASGLARSIREWVDGEAPEQWTACCEVQRKGEADPVTTAFSVADARRAGLWGKTGPWTTYPRRMLQMRARAFALRDVFADVLGGLYLREEIEDGLDGEISSRWQDQAAGVTAEPEHGQAESRAEPPAGNPALSRVDRSDATAPSIDANTPGPANGAHSEDVGAHEHPLPLTRPRRSLPRRPRRPTGWLRLKPPREAIRLRAPAPPEYAAVHEAETQTSPRQLEQVIAPPNAGSPPDLSADETLSLYDHALACARDDASLQEIEDEFVSRLAPLSREHRGQAVRIRIRHLARVADLNRESRP